MRHLTLSQNAGLVLPYYEENITPITWDYTYDCSVLPNAADPAWTKTGTLTTISSDGNILDINDTSNTKSVYYKLFDNNLLYPCNFELEIKFKFISFSDTIPFRIVSIYDKNKIIYLSFQNSTKTIGFSNNYIYNSPFILGYTYNYTSLSDWHIFKIKKTSTHIQLYLDNNLVINNLYSGLSNYSSENPNTQFGEYYNPRQYRFNYDYIRYRIT